MKTFRMIGMALFAVLLCVNFASCSTDDDDPTGNPSVSEKRLARTMKYGIENGKEELNSIIDFKYNQENKLTAVYERELYSDDWHIDTQNFIWDANNSITHQWGKYTLTNGKVTKEHHYEAGQYDFYLYYDYDNDGHLKGCEYASEEDGEKVPAVIFTWENGNLTSFAEADDINNPEMSYIYDNKNYNGFFPLFYEYTVWEDENYIFMALPELVGIKTKNLPKMIIDGSYTYDFEYEFDQDNYITSCTVNKKYYGEHSYSEEYYYEFAWE